MANPEASAGLDRSVVITALEKINSVVTHEVHEPVLLSDSPRPGPGCEVFQRFRLSGPFERIADHRFHEIQNLESDSAIFAHPPAEILQKLALKNGLSSRGQVRVSGAPL